MVIITWNSAEEIEVIDAIRGAIGRDTTWYIVASSNPCPTCSLDPINNTSTDSFCPTCSGVYWIPEYSGATISGHVTWGFSERPGWETGGKLQEGDCRVQIKYTPEHVAIIEQALWASIDNRKMLIKKILLRGVKEINRILVDLIEKEKE